MAEKKSETVIEILNYIIAQFEVSVEELDVPQDFLKNPQNQRLDSLLNKVR
ncbi:MAG: hypothetical protein H6767_00040 [Candidatus Peribacteria bacterium]|nr:MAG: hypothetical protein H6767_00040 [Candidatus Peribacteria bacterium]